MTELIDRILEMPTRQRVLLIVGSIGLVFFLYANFIYWPRSTTIAEKQANLDAMIASRDAKAIHLRPGIGVGGMMEGNLMHGLIHPEMGHILLRKKEGDQFEGVCPYHKNCLEGLASGPAMQKRWNVSSATSIDINHMAWDIEAYYLAEAISNWIMCISSIRSSRRILWSFTTPLLM